MATISEHCNKFTIRKFTQVMPPGTKVLLFLIFKIIGK